MATLPRMGKILERLGRWLLLRYVNIAKNRYALKRLGLCLFCFLKSCSAGSYKQGLNAPGNAKLKILSKEKSH